MPDMKEWEKHKANLAAFIDYVASFENKEIAKALITKMCVEIFEEGERPKGISSDVH